MKKTWAGTAALLLVAGCGEETFETPPDCAGTRMVVYARYQAPDTVDVLLYDFDLMAFHLLPGLNTTQYNEVNPAISADGRLIAFERRLAHARADIQIYDRCSASIIPQPGLSSTTADRDPAFTHDGLRLAFVRDTLGGTAIRLYDASTDRLVPLPGIEAANAIDHSPSPDQSGNRIAFVSNRNGNQDVLVYDAAGDSILDLPDLASAGQDVDPWLSPNGRWLVFASDRTGNAGLDLYLYDLQTLSFVAEIASANTISDEWHPTMDPSAEHVVFESNRDPSLGETDLWIYTRSAGTVDRVGASGSEGDIQPYLVWP